MVSQQLDCLNDGLKKSDFLHLRAPVKQAAKDVTPSLGPTAGDVRAYMRPGRIGPQPILATPNRRV